MNKFDLAVRPIYHRLRNRIEGHICICFTAYTVMLELERILKAAKSEITIYRAQELTKNIYAITYALPRSKQVKKGVPRHGRGAVGAMQARGAWMGVGHVSDPTRKTGKGTK